MEEGKKTPENNNSPINENTSKKNKRSLSYFSRIVGKNLQISVKALRTVTAYWAQVYKNDSLDDSAAADIRQAFSHLNYRVIVFVSLGMLLVFYIFTGIYVVNPGEVAVVKMFGNVVKESVGEGIHFRFPWPVEEVDVANVATIRREGIGTMLPEHQSIHSSPDIIQILTGDENIIDIKAVVQYRVKDAEAYLYNVKHPPYLLINETIRSAITDIGGTMRVDEILTVGKEHLQRLIQEDAQETLDQYKSGLQLVGINLNKIYPPEEVAEAFRDVSNAKQDKEKTINDSLGYRNTVIPQARGDANRKLREGEAYKIDVINRAGGEAARFENMLTEYNTNKQIYSADVTRYRLYLENMETVMSRVKKYMVNTSKGGKINLRLFDSK